VHRDRRRSTGGKHHRRGRRRHRRGDASGFLFKERVSTPLLIDPHFSSQLIERIGWALADAEEPERTSDGSTR
jgi:hypothetical protein